MALGRHGSFKRVNAMPQQGCCVKGCKPVIGHPADHLVSVTERPIFKAIQDPKSVRFAALLGSNSRAFDRAPNF